MSLKTSFNQQSKMLSKFTVRNKMFWIQYMEPALIDQIVEAMSSEFLQDEPFGKFGNTLNNASFLHQYKLSYCDILQKGTSIVCMTNDDQNKPIMVGFHCQEMTSYPSVDGEFRFGYSVLLHLLKFRNICEELNIERFLVDRGLFVYPKYRGNGIGFQLLKCWPLTCKEANVKLGLGLFSSRYSQSCAERAGLIKLKYMSYEDARKKIPDDIPIGIEQHTNGMQLSYISI